MEGKGSYRSVRREVGWGREKAGVSKARGGVTMMTVARPGTRKIPGFADKEKNLWKPVAGSFGGGGGTGPFTAAVKLY